MIKNMIPETTKRVAKSTSPEINLKIRNQTIHNINLYKKGSPELLTDRLKKLDSEWDTERCLETKAALLVLITSILGIKSSRCFFLITGTIGVFLLQHALCGWCPPLSIIRKAGIRTSEEIHNEKTVLKMYRGDFLQNSIDVTEMLGQAEK